MKLKYSDLFGSQHPALFVNLFIRPSELYDWQEIVAKIDTGADFTAFPKHLLDVFQNLEIYGYILISGYTVQDSDGILHPIYLFDVTLDKKGIFKIESVFIEQKTYALLGRDILNQLLLIADGPKGVFELN